jgi:hypothetical protein
MADNRLETLHEIETNSASLVLACLILPIFTIYCFYGILIYYKNRDLEAIGIRRPFTVIIAALSLVGLTLTRNILPLLGNSVKCFEDVFPPLFMFFMASTMFLCRIVFLKMDARKLENAEDFFRLRNTNSKNVKKVVVDDEDLARHSASLARLGDVEEEYRDMGTMEKEKFIGQLYLNDRKVVLIAMIIYFIHILPHIIYTSDNVSLTELDTIQDLCFTEVRLFTSITTIVFLCIDIIAAFILVFSIKNVQEAWNIKQEFKYIGWISSAVAVVFAINVASRRAIEAFVNGLIHAQVYFLFGLVIPVSLLVYLVLIRTRLAKSSPVARDIAKSFDEEAESLALLRMINSQDGFIEFQKHLKKEFLFSYLMFWKDVENYRIKEIDALTIIETYIVKNAPSFLKFPESIIRPIMQQFNQIPEDKIEESIKNGFILSDLGPISSENTNLFDEAYIFVFKKLLEAYIRYKSTHELTPY